MVADKGLTLVCVQIVELQRKLLKEKQKLQRQQQELGLNYQD
jgi:hypothetical protein